MKKQRFCRQVRIRKFVSFFMVLMALSCLIPLADGVTAQSSLDSDFSRILPPVEVCEGEAVQLNGKVTSSFSQSFKVDQSNGLINITMLSTDFEFRGSFTPQLRVIKSEFAFKNQDLTSFLGYNRRVSSWDETGKINVKYYQGDHLKAEKFFPDTNVIDSDITLFYLQGMLLKSAGSFEHELYAKKDGFKVNASFKLVTTTDFVKLAPDYNFSDNLRRISAQKKEVLVYIMEIKGLPRLFYSGKYYYVYEKNEPYNLIAYWGGLLPEAEYGYVLK